MDDERIVKVLGRSPGGLVTESDDGTQGELRKLREGEPMPPGAEVVEVSHDAHDDDEPCTMRLKTVMRVGHSRPSTTAYRRGWDRVFGKEAN